MRFALARAGGTTGEWANALREVFGVYRAPTGVRSGVAQRGEVFAGLVGRENVLAGTDCGLGGRVHPEIAWAKLKTLAEGAALATKQLWG